ncbi:MAG: DegT/DnrJ/EryC1/StrS family aminotransferase [Paramuribaculum sp.]|nr:DegT/DnrJ/EryC1/StrS family aminotransferase [Paramuribaculum sp.]
MKRYPFLDLATVNAPYIDALREAADRVLCSGRYIGGSEVEALERWLCSYTGTGYAVGVSTGLDALRLIIEGYKVLGRLSEGDEVIVPGNTYVASVLAISQAGLRPVLVDPDETTMNLSGASIRNALTEKIKAVMLVHLYGRVAWDKEISTLVREHGLIVVEDAAQAIGAEGIGRVGDAAAISFYPTKNLGALGDGGAIVTDDCELAKAVRALANYGSDRRYHNIYKGFNCRLDPIQAALIMAKNHDLDLANGRRRERAKLYSTLIDNALIRTPEMPADELSHVWHQYVVRVADALRDEFRQFLLNNGVETDIHYAVPPHRQPCYYNELSEFHLPTTERLADEIVSLPISDCTSLSDIAEICDIINRFRLSGL